ncbi:MAG: acyl-CoA dehydrogenase family protein, partial [Pseudomonadota bacterium]
LVTEPYLATVVVCGGFLKRSNDAQRATWLPELMAGTQQWAFATAEANSRYTLADVSTVAVKSTAGYTLSGKKISVLNGAAADQLIVSARTSGDRRDPYGVSLFIVPANAGGVTRESYPLVDGSMGADIQFDNVELSAEQRLGVEGQGLALMEAVVGESMVAIGAECLGAMDALLEQTVAYTQTREQFGQPISRFQSLQHRMADMYLACESLRSLLYYAAILQRDAALGARGIGAEEANKASAALKVKAGDAGRFVSQQAVQLHGGIGMTDELGVSHYFKRLLLLNTLFGDSEHHLEAYLAA